MKSSAPTFKDIRLAQTKIKTVVESLASTSSKPTKHISKKNTDSSIPQLLKVCTQLVGKQHRMNDRVEKELEDFEDFKRG